MHLPGDRYRSKQRSKKVLREIDELLQTTSGVDSQTRDQNQNNDALSSNNSTRYKKAPSYDFGHAKSSLTPLLRFKHRVPPGPGPGQYNTALPLKSTSTMGIVPWKCPTCHLSRPCTSKCGCPAESKEQHSTTVAEAKSIRRESKHVSSLKYCSESKSSWVPLRRDETKKHYADAKDSKSQYWEFEDKHVQPDHERSSGRCISEAKIPYRTQPKTTLAKAISKPAYCISKYKRCRGPTWRALKATGKIHTKRQWILYHHRRRQRTHGGSTYRAVKHHLVEPRIKGTRAFGVEQRSKKRSSRIKMQAAYQRVLRSRRHVNDTNLDTTRPPKSVFQYHLPMTKTRKKPVIPLLKWLDAQLHQAWIPEDGDKNEESCSKAKDGQRVLSIQASKKKREASALSSALGPGKYHVIISGTFEQQSQQTKTSNAYDTQLGRHEIVGPFGERPEQHQSNVNEGQTLELNVDDRAIRPRVTGGVITGSNKPEPDVSTDHDGLYWMDDLMPNFDFGKTRTKGGLAFEKQLGRRPLVNERYGDYDRHEEACILDLNYDTLLENASGWTPNFDRMSGRNYDISNSGNTTTSIDYLSPPAFGQGSTKVHVNFSKMTERWPAPVTNTLEPLILCDDPVQLAVQVLSQYARSQRGNVSMKLQSSRSSSSSLKPKGRDGNREELDLNPKWTVGKKRTPVGLVRMDRSTDRWQVESKKSEEGQNLQLDMTASEILSRHARTTTTTQMSKGTERFS